MHLSSSLSTGETTSAEALIIRVRTGPVPGSGPNRANPRPDWTGLGSFLDRRQSVCGIFYTICRDINFHLTTCHYVGPSTLYHLRPGSLYSVDVVRPSNYS